MIVICVENYLHLSYIILLFTRPSIVCCWHALQVAGPNLSTPILQDLVGYKKYRNKVVSSAARGLVGLFRELAPGLLEKRDRGRGADLARQVQQYGYRESATRVLGADLLEAALLEEGSDAEEGLGSEEEVGSDEELSEESGSHAAEDELEQDAAAEVSYEDHSNEGVLSDDAAEEHVSITVAAEDVAHSRKRALESQPDRCAVCHAQRGTSQSQCIMVESIPSQYRPHRTQSVIAAQAPGSCSQAG